MCESTHITWELLTIKLFADGQSNILLEIGYFDYFTCIETIKKLAHFVQKPILSQFLGPRLPLWN